MVCEKCDYFEPKANVFGVTYYYENGTRFLSDEGFGYADEYGRVTWYDGYKPQNDEFHLTEVYPIT